MPSRGAVQGVRDDMKEAREAGIGMTVNSVSRYTHNFLNHKPWHPLNFSGECQVQWEPLPHDRCLSLSQLYTCAPSA